MKRRDFLKISGIGAAGTVAGTVAGTAGMMGWSPSASASTVSVNLNTVKGTVNMADGSSIYTFSFSTGSVPTLPGPMIVCWDKNSSGVATTISVSIHNTLSTPVRFVVGRTSVALSVPAGATKSVSFAAPKPGTYLYYDDQNNGVNRILGLHGTLVVMPSGIKNKSFVGGPTFTRQTKWCLSSLDPNWGSLVQTNGDAYVSSIGASSYMPKYFCINGESFDQSEEANTALAGSIGQACLVRLLNAGGMIHSPHFHGNHVEILSVNGTNYSGARIKKDIVSMFPLDCRDVIYPFTPPPDAYPAVSGAQGYPMHCHSEMSQTCGGGLYPHGLHTAITLGQAPTTESDLQLAVNALI